MCMHAGPYLGLQLTEISGRFQRGVYLLGDPHRTHLDPAGLLDDQLRYLLLCHTLLLLLPWYSTENFG